MAGINFTAAIAAIRAAAQRGLADAADVVHQEAQRRAPKETGDLRNSAGTASEGLEAVIFFSAPYALKQHEEVGYHHQDGEAKYLENAVIAKREVANQVIAQAIRGAMT